MLERNFKKHVQKTFRDAGWIVIQLQIISGISMGFPDTLFIGPKAKIFFVEWKKSDKAKFQPLQKYWHKKLRDMGHQVYVIYPENYLIIQEKYLS